MSSAEGHSAGSPPLSRVTKSGKGPAGFHFAVQQRAMSSAGGHSSKSLPLPNLKVMAKGKGRDPGPSVFAVGDGNVGSGMSSKWANTRLHPAVTGTSIEARSVAVKAIRTYSADDGHNARRKKHAFQSLRREIRVWLNLDHTNVLPLFGTTVGFGQFPAMVCQWLVDGPLTSYLERRDDRLTIGGRLVLLHDVAVGLQYRLLVHSQTVVHGDLSGSNVLIYGNGRACIADFGLSTLLTALGEPTFSTSFKGKGTLRWAAPELFHLNAYVPGDEENLPRDPPTPQSDIYSFGGIMLQVCDYLALPILVPQLRSGVDWKNTVSLPHDERVLIALSQGETPKRPSGGLITDDRRSSTERCWSSVDARPSDDEVVGFTRNEPTQCMLPQV
ncbi:kinase-like protein [Paxillus ammoniavirescens]|nr:kinase-like protein [Paxillus ammoniavirescens]